MEKGCVYFFKHRKLTPIKIGYSTNESPSDRFDQFKTYAPFGCVIVGFIVTTEPKKLETKLHKQFSSSRLNGEWFEITEETVSGLVNLHSSNEQNELHYLIQKEMAERFKTKERNKDIHFDYFDSVIMMDERYYNSNFKDCFNLRFDEGKDNRYVLNKIKAYCKFNNVDLKRGRDSTGRYFNITRRK